MRKYYRLLAIPCVACICIILFAVAIVVPAPKSDTMVSAHLKDPVSKTTILPGIAEQPTATATASPSAAPNKLAPAAYADTKDEVATVVVPILMYHYVRNMYNPQDTMGYTLSVPPKVFEEELAYLKVRGFTTISPEELYQAIVNRKPLPPKPILLSFDDGYADYLSDATPALKEYNAKSTIFIPTSLIGTPNYLTWDQLKTIAKDPNVTIGAHTKTHADLPTLPPDKVADEIIGGKAVLESEIGKKVDFFAYPYGAFNAAIIETVKRAGFKEAFSTIEGRTDSVNDLYTIRRIEVKGQDQLAQFVALVGT